VRRWIAPLAVTMVALYVVLAVGATTCLLSPSEPTTPRHHHSQSHVAHSAFCAWACQVNPTVGILAMAPSISLAAVVSLSSLFAPVVITEHAAIASSSRAPPLFV